MRTYDESRASLEVWWFKLQGLCEEVASELDTHSVHTTDEPDAHHKRARRAPLAGQTRTVGEPDMYCACSVGEPNMHCVRIRWALCAHLT